MKKNNKGFTLVELLAVIVVLAIIMVIATQQINKTINRSRAKSFNEAFNIVVENTRILYVEGELDEAELKTSLDYNSNDYEVIFKDNVVCIDAIEKNGKFKNVKMLDTDQFDMDTLGNKDYYYNNQIICTSLDSQTGIISAPTIDTINSTWTGKIPTTE